MYPISKHFDPQILVRIILLINNLTYSLSRLIKCFHNFSYIFSNLNLIYFLICLSNFIHFIFYSLYFFICFIFGWKNGHCFEALLFYLLVQKGVAHVLEDLLKLLHSYSFSLWLPIEVVFVIWFFVNLSY